MLVVGVGVLSGCAKLAVRSADEAAQAAKKGSDDVARSADDAAAAGKGDEAASKADDADGKTGDDGKTLSDSLSQRAKKKARDEARDELEESLRETPDPTSSYDPYATDFEDEVTVGPGAFVYWELPFRTWGESASRPSESVSVYYTVDTSGFTESVDVFLFEEYWFEEYSRGRESKYITAGSGHSSGARSMTADTSLPTEDYVLVIDNTAAGEASGETSADVLLRFNSSSTF